MTKRKHDKIKKVKIAEKKKKKLKCTVPASKSMETKKIPIILEYLNTKTKRQYFKGKNKKKKL